MTRIILPVVMFVAVTGLGVSTKSKQSLPMILTTLKTPNLPPMHDIARVIPWRSTPWTCPPLQHAHWLGRLLAAAVLSERKKAQ